jgi:hypothetical protein
LNQIEYLIIWERLEKCREEVEDRAHNRKEMEEKKTDVKEKVEELRRRRKRRRRRRNKGPRSR